jgi:hypothetical protein
MCTAPAIRTFFKSIAPAISITVLLGLLAMAPIAAVLEVHHALGAVDQDGHQHSDSDLCQWIQHHAGNSLQPVLPSVAATPTIGQHELPVLATLSSSGLIAVGPARAPPIA